MPRVALHDRKQIADFLCQDKGLHLYSLGDLDPFFWPQTLWLGWEKEPGELQALVLIYLGQSLPTVLAFGSPTPALQELLKSLHGLLPPRFYLHLSAGLRAHLDTGFVLHSHGEHSRMVLNQPDKLARALADRDLSPVMPLGGQDLEAIRDLYQHSYPGNWFDARMLETGMYRGIFHGSKLVSIAGIHVYSPEWKVAALGNITTAPEVRGQGLGTLTTAVLCQDLLKHVDLIGLNVKSDNRAALACYHKLGFSETARFEEFEAQLKLP